MRVHFIKGLFFLWNIFDVIKHHFRWMVISVLVVYDQNKETIFLNFLVTLSPTSYYSENWSPAKSFDHQDRLGMDDQVDLRWGRQLQTAPWLVLECQRATLGCFFNRTFVNNCFVNFSLTLVRETEGCLKYFLLFFFLLGGRAQHRQVVVYGWT